MKQILQDLKKGGTHVVDVPAPALLNSHVLIRTKYTLISAGTERMLVKFGRSSMLDKARQQPDKVRMVIDKVKTDGLMPTVQAVQSKLDQPLPLGYSNVGTVIEVGEGVDDLSVGDTVVSNGNHAEIVCVPRNLCAVVPNEVSLDSAVFTVISAIALQGIRLIRPTVGENIVVTGLGLIGLVAVQILRANGCNVLGVDINPKRCELARKFGAETVDLSSGEDIFEKANKFSNSRGVDGVLLCASTESDEPVKQAAKICRQRGRIVLVGVAGLNLSRADFYEKEISFQVSCSYGPGRYDSSYEEHGNDYPYGLVRWTEQRNFEAVLGLMQSGSLIFDELISHRFDIDSADEAYDLLTKESPMGIILQFPNDESADKLSEVSRILQLNSSIHRQSAPGNIGMIGSGNYASQILIPAFKASGANLAILASAGGISSVHNGKKFGFDSASSDADAVVRDNSTDTIVVATRHDSHANYTISALNAGKHVFVEKPIAINRTQLEEIKRAYIEAQNDNSQPLLMVGFNRRFSPLTIKLKSLLDKKSEPKSIVMTVNAGEIPADHWAQDPVQGGGRIIGEACHFIDLFRFIIGSPIIKVNAIRVGNAPGIAIRDDKASIMLEFADGSFGTVHYLANGHRSFPKERLEVFCGNAILQIDNFRVLRSYGWNNFNKIKLSRQDKGNVACVSAFISAVKNGHQSPIPANEIFEVSDATFDAVDALHQ
ncbi:MAG: bi-domain-containing oxidoreductase [Pseudomonadota bacterium]|nr:bi-domain-containing oxidoreductase [Pseudomonadota bacterium]